VLLAYFGVHGAAALIAGSFTSGGRASVYAASLGNGLAVLLLAILAGTQAGPGCSPRAVLGLVAPRQIRPGRIFGIFAAGVFAYMAASMAMAQVWRLWGEGGTQLPRQDVVSIVTSIKSPPVLAAALVLAVFLAPLAEELVFRRALYIPLRNALGVPAATLLVSLVFAAAHGYVWGFPQLAILSVMFVALYESTGTLWASVLGHAFHNALMLVLLFSVGLPG
jgi:membrane protease YdiL (CAAX protease family)